MWASAPVFNSYGRVDSWQDTSGQADRYGRRDSSGTGEGGRASCRRRWWSTSGLGSRPGAKACECSGSRLSGLATVGRRLQCDHSFTGSWLMTLLSGRWLRELAGVFVLLVGYCRIRCGLRVVCCCRFCCCHMAAGFHFGLFDRYRYSPSFLLPRPISCQTVAAERVRSSFVGLYVNWISTSPAVSFRRGRGGLRQSTTGRQAAGRPRPLSDGLRRT